MNTPRENDVTVLLARWRGGSAEAEAQLMERVQSELRRLAAGYVRRERPGATLQATAVVNEAYMRLLPQRRVSWENRAHFFGIAAKMMRRVLVDHARRRRAAKRDAGAADPVSISCVAEPAREADPISDSNPRFADAPNDTRSIDLQKHGFTFMYRISPSLDVGAGLGWLRFSAPAFPHVNKWLLTPLSVSYVPFGFVHADLRDGWTRLGRILRPRYAENYLPQGISAAGDFQSRDSKYFKSGDVARSFGILLDFGSYLPFP